MTGGAAWDMQEKPDAILPTMGGQTGLNIAKGLAESGGCRAAAAPVAAVRLPGARRPPRGVLRRSAGGCHACLWATAVQGPAASASCAVGGPGPHAHAPTLRDPPFCAQASWISTASS